LGFHAVFASGLEGSASWLKPYASRLEVGVSIFFLISGFLLYRPFARAHIEDRTAPTLSHYTSSRLLRIFPAYWIALALIALWISLEGVFDWPGLFVYFGLLQNYSTETLGGGLLQAWSLVVEMSFYIFLPLFAIGISRLPGRDERARWRNQWIGIGTLFAIGILWNIGVLTQVGIEDEASGPLLASLPGYFDQFALGMGLALVGILAGEGRLKIPGVLASGGIWVVALAAAAGAFVVASRGIGLEGGYEEITSLQWFVKHVLFSLVALALLAPVAMGLGGAGPIGRLFELRALRWVGLVSYGIFLWHLAILTKLRDWDLGLSSGSPTAWVQWVLVALALTLVVAAVSWYAIERPALAARDGLAERVRAAFSPQRRRPVGESDGVE
jgi:peptidoglycan/LPS O-acetylase OafA/YrhL